MAKRYYKDSGSMNHMRDHFNDEHKSEKDKGERGMMRKALTGAEQYAGMETRRRRELEDAGMIHEDHSAIANLPQYVKIAPYPKTGPYLPEDIDDTIRGVDGQMDYDNEHRAAHMYPKKV